MSQRQQNKAHGEKAMMALTLDRCVLDHFSSTDDCRAMSDTGQDGARVRAQPRIVPNHALRAQPRNSVTGVCH
jgi:hypothetical protein